jgi:hypothetical protein
VPQRQAGVPTIAPAGGLVHGLAVVTRNAEDFVQALDPWQPPSRDDGE